jgi:hypothetical protein
MSTCLVQDWVKHVFWGLMHEQLAPLNYAQHILLASPVWPSSSECTNRVKNSDPGFSWIICCF